METAIKIILLIGVGVFLYIFIKDVFFTKKLKVIETPNWDEGFVPQLTDIEQKLLSLVIQYKGVKLINSPSMNTLCSRHCYNMIVEGEPSHEGFPIRSDKCMKAGADNVGEIIGYGYKTPNAFINGFLASPDHRRQLESKNHTHVGIALKQDPFKNYYCSILFANFKEK